MDQSAFIFQDAVGLQFSEQTPTKLNLTRSKRGPASCFVLFRKTDTDVVQRNTTPLAPLTASTPDVPELEPQRVRSGDLSSDVGVGVHDLRERFKLRKNVSYSKWIPRVTGSTSPSIDSWPTFRRAGVVKPQRPVSGGESDSRRGPRRSTEKPDGRWETWSAFVPDPRDRSRGSKARPQCGESLQNPNTSLGPNL